MPTLALKDIEQTAKTLFLNREAREKFLLGKNTAINDKSSVLDELSQNVLPYLDKDGVVLYAGLLSYGFHEVMDSVYPGCAKLIDNDWQNVVDSYLLAFPPNHYNLNQLTKSFALYLSKSGHSCTKKFPFLTELADYEWLELELMEFQHEVMKAQYELLVDPQQLERYAPVINNSLVIRKYQYPIPKIVDYLQENNDDWGNIEKKITVVAIFRDPETLYSRFVELEETSAALIDMAQKKVTSYKDLMFYALSLRLDVDPQQSVIDFLTLIEKLQSCNLFIGSAPVS